jgi:hypothetical protein
MDDWDHLDELDDPSTWFFGGHRKRIARKGCGVSMKGWRMVNDWNILRFTEFTVSCSVAMFVHMSLKLCAKQLGQQNIASPPLTGILVFSLAWSIDGRPIERRGDHFAVFLLKNRPGCPRPRRRVAGLVPMPSVCLSSIRSCT